MKLEELKKHFAKTLRTKSVEWQGETLLIGALSSAKVLPLLSRRNELISKCIINFIDESEEDIRTHIPEKFHEEILSWKRAGNSEDPSEEWPNFAHWRLSEAENIELRDINISLICNGVIDSEANKILEGEEDFVGRWEDEDIGRIGAEILTFVVGGKEEVEAGDENFTEEKSSQSAEVPA